ncbi:MAG: MOSC domain-containing protein [Anaerolineae bacterium]|nr:MOSC domain-containing protein [Anaerolineae bacterium]
MPHLIAVNSSTECTKPKTSVDAGELIAGYGLVGDAHAGLSEREISLVTIENIEAANQRYGIQAGPGAFAENLTTEGLDASTLKVGDRLRVGPTLLEVVQLGKPRTAAHTYNYQGVSILPNVGVFCRVIEGGRVVPGDSIEVLPAFKP